MSASSTSGSNLSSASTASRISLVVPISRWPFLSGCGGGFAAQHESIPRSRDGKGDGDSRDIGPRYSATCPEPKGGTCQAALGSAGAETAIWAASCSARGGFRCPPLVPDRGWIPATEPERTLSRFG